MKITVCDICREERPDCREVPCIRVDICDRCLDSRKARVLFDAIAAQNAYDEFDPVWSRG